MKKNNFIAMVLGTISGVLFALGMCMVLIPEWNMFRPGILLGSAGLLLALATLLIWRKMTHKKSIRISGKIILTSLIGILGARTLGIGMCCCMVWNKMAAGIIIGLTGLVILLSLIPLTKGIKE